MTDMADDEARLAKFYPMECMADRDFVLYGVSIIAHSLQGAIDAWMPILDGTPNYHEIEDPYWDLIANVRLCTATKLLDDRLIEDFAIFTQLAGMFLDEAAPSLADDAPTRLVNSLKIVDTLDRVLAAKDPDTVEADVLKLNLSTTRDRYRMAARMLDHKLFDIAGSAAATPRARFSPKSTVDPAGLSEIDRKYRAAVGAYEVALQAAIDFSRLASGRPSETRQIAWSALLFTRLCNFGSSVARLTPGSAYSDWKADRYWDNSAVSTLARAIYECFLLFFYLGIDEIPDDESLARQTLMYLHDATMRLRVFHHSPEPNEAKAQAFYTAQRGELIGQLEGSAYFNTLTDRQREKFRRGRDLYFLSQDEILEKMGLQPQELRRNYEFLSAHAHSLPVAFMRAMEDGRGRGVENDPEKAYMGQTLNFVAGILTSATEFYRAASEPYIDKAAPLESGST